MRSFVAAFDRVAAVVACALLIALLTCVSLGVVTRELNAPLIWTDELSRFLMVWLAVFGWILASRKRIQVRIRYFQDRLPAAGRKVVEIAIQAALATLGTLIAVYSVGLVIRNHDLEATSLPLSMSWMYAPMVLAGALTALQALAELVETARRSRVPAPPMEIEVE
jgi:TRAP-type C4-dicarboxylate transport system permease small subunit